MEDVIDCNTPISVLSVLTQKTRTSFSVTVSSLKDQRKGIRELEHDLAALGNVLDGVQVQVQVPDVKAGLECLRSPLEGCLLTCTELHKQLKKCILRATDNRTTVREWLRKRYDEKSFDEMRQQLVSFTSTLVLGLKSMNIERHSMSQDSLDSLASSIKDTRDDLEDQIDRAQQGLDTEDESLRELRQDEQSRLQSCLETLQNAETIVNAARPTVVVKRNEGDASSTTIFGTDTIQPRFSLAVADHKAGIGAYMAAGVHSPDTLRALINNAHPQIDAYTLQTLRSRSPYVSRPGEPATVIHIPGGILASSLEAIENGQPTYMIPGNNRITSQSPSVAESPWRPQHETTISSRDPRSVRFN